ncbi:hypothetical protein ACWEFD_36175 [Streptomyces ardesiacus]|uniref:hypothetical protein n=1 Tax=Streptomyces TaxID=1883 RepID=UPI0004BD0E26|nr:MULTISPECIES: hypothetical protein [Streptomyces]
MIAVVGHADLTPGALTLVEEALSVRLARYAGAGRMGLVRVGQGLPVAVARAAKKAGLALVTAVPTLHQVPALLREGDRSAAGELLMLSQHVRLIEYDPLNHASCVRADEGMLRTCGRVLAVWDGSASTGHDATAHLVAYARRHGIKVEVLWPKGGGRSPAAVEELS